jgi:hypothetical protein
MDERAATARGALTTFSLHDEHGRLTVVALSLAVLQDGATTYR